MSLEIGLVNEMTLTVQESDTARFSGGETLPPVFSTPRMISFMERAAHYSLLPYLKEGQTSVGVQVHVRHIASTPVGAQVRVRAEVIQIDRRRVRFRIEAWDAIEKIGEGEHDRFIVDIERFYEKLNAKESQLWKRTSEGA